MLGPNLAISGLVVTIVQSVKEFFVRSQVQPPSPIFSLVGIAFRAETIGLTCISYFPSFQQALTVKLEVGDMVLCCALRRPSSLCSWCLKADKTAFL